ncbi:hypothetical protein PEX2_044870 [Penicillium expansum]|uniref:Uncharacterized protein n=1 Tax=Penicillium expansum TaxID=27334 RepID=A0A0A2K5F1_PENEN|nr:hypothetical protein PEX2_044870 [Penicillium expansum]KGO62964.1 hypothetical protein PEX2_044870 [Penicillium expansum]
MTSKSIVQASSEPNVELKSYISLDRSLHDAREIYESFASIVESSRPLPANFSGSLFYFQVQNRIAKFFSNPRPRLVEPEDYFDTPLEWTDVLRESLAPESFKHARDDLYHCCVQGKWIEVTENDRSEILCGVLEGLMDSLTRMSESRQRQKFQNHFDETFEFVQKLNADMAKTKQLIQEANNTQNGDTGDRDSYDLLDLNPPPSRDRLRISDKNLGPTPPSISPPLSTTPETLPTDAGRKPDTAENQTNISASDGIVPSESEISNKNTGNFARNMEADTLSVVCEIPSTSNKETSRQPPSTVNKTFRPIVSAISKVAVSQTPVDVNKVTGSQTPAAFNKQAISQSPRAVNKFAVDQPTNNVVSQALNTVSKITVGQAPTTANKATVNKPTKNATNHTPRAAKKGGISNNKAASQTPSTTKRVAAIKPAKNAVNNGVVGQPASRTLAQTPRVVHQDYISQAINNAEKQTPRTGATFQTSGAVDKVAAPQQAPSTILEDFVNQNSENVHKEASGQTTIIDKQRGNDVITNKRTSHVAIGTVDGYSMYTNDVTTQSTNKDTPNAVDKAVVGDDEDVESVGSDIPYDVNSHLTSNLNTAVAQFEAIRRGDVSVQLSAQARREALVARYSQPLRGSKSYTSREIEEAPGFIQHVLEQGYSHQELEEGYNWIFCPNYPRTSAGLLRKFIDGRKRKLDLTMSQSQDSAKRLKGPDSAKPPSPSPSEWSTQ